TYYRSYEALQASIAAVGLLNPPVLWQAVDGGRYVIVCGYQRLLACRDLQYPSVPAQVYRAAEKPALDAFRMNLLDNLTVRTLNPVEKAMVIRRLRLVFQVPVETILSTYHRLLGLPPQRPTMDDYFNLATLPQAMQEALLREELSLESARRLTRFP